MPLSPFASSAVVANPPVPPASVAASSVVVGCLGLAANRPASFAASFAVAASLVDLAYCSRASFAA